MKVRNMGEKPLTIFTQASLIIFFFLGKNYSFKNYIKISKKIELQLIFKKNPIQLK